MVDAALLERLAERCAGPIRWGVNDCVPLCADHLRERTGDDLLGEWRGRYSTREERDAILGHPHGFVRLVLQRMHAAPGWRRVAPADARDPALGLAFVENCWVVAIALGAGIGARAASAGSSSSIHRTSGGLGHTMGIELALATAIATTFGVSTATAATIAAVTIANPAASDDGWITVDVPDQRENPKVAGWRAIGADPKYVEAVRAAMQSAPEGVEVRGLAVDRCLSPLIVEGDVMGADDGMIRPGSVAVFRKTTDPLASAKVYLGASWIGGPVAAFLCLQPAAWVMHVPVGDLAELRRVTHIWRAGEWFEPDTSAAVARAPRLLTRGVHRVMLLPIGGKVEPLIPAASPSVVCG